MLFFCIAQKNTTFWFIWKTYHKISTQNNHPNTHLISMYLIKFKLVKSKKNGIRKKNRNESIIKSKIGR